MKISMQKGLSYGVTSGAITTLGLMIGLYFSGSPENVILAGVLTIAFADAFSDGLGIHISEEAENKHTHKEVWEATISTIVAKMFFALTFAIAIIVLPIETALIVNIIWGLLLISLLCIYIARQGKNKVLPILAEHVGIGALVVVGSYFVGELIKQFCN